MLSTTLQLSIPSWWRFSEYYLMNKQCWSVSNLKSFYFLRNLFLCAAAHIEWIVSCSFYWHIFSLMCCCLIFHVTDSSECYLLLYWSFFIGGQYFLALIFFQGAPYNLFSPSLFFSSSFIASLFFLKRDPT